jgi:hypothetical protein
LNKSFSDIEEKMREISWEQDGVQQEIRKLRKSSPRTFIEAVEIRNALSVLELTTHEELQDLTLKWLYNLGHIVAGVTE